MFCVSPLLSVFLSVCVFFFFFKQKTAYEMRISDWSSDVCSSDLLIPSLTAEENVRLVTDIAEKPMDAADALALVGLADRRDHYPAQLSGGEQQQIGRASCRERVWQYV